MYVCTCLHILMVKPIKKIKTSSNSNFTKCVPYERVNTNFVFIKLHPVVHCQFSQMESLCANFFLFLGRLSNDVIKYHVRVNWCQTVSSYLWISEIYPEVQASIWESDGKQNSSNIRRMIEMMNSKYENTLMWKKFCFFICSKNDANLLNFWYLSGCL